MYHTYRRNAIYSKSRAQHACTKEKRLVRLCMSSVTSKYNRKTSAFLLVAYIEAPYPVGHPKCTAARLTCRIEARTASPSLSTSHVQISCHVRECTSRAISSESRGCKRSELPTVPKFAEGTLSHAEQKNCRKEEMRTCEKSMKETLTIVSGKNK